MVAEADGTGRYDGVGGFGLRHTADLLGVCASGKWAAGASRAGKGHEHCHKMGSRLPKMETVADQARCVASSSIRHQHRRELWRRHQTALNRLMSRGQTQ